eukprot:3154603-Rhodomonas_salina.1
MVFQHLIPYMDSIPVQRNRFPLISLKVYDWATDAIARIDDIRAVEATSVQPRPDFKHKQSYLFISGL